MFDDNDVDLILQS